MDSVMELAPVGGVEVLLHDQLLDRRERLQRARSQVGTEPDFTRLLNEVDAALMRFDKGTYGLCEECHDAIEPERLIADPLVRLCLGDLTQKQLNLLQDDLQLAAEIQKGLLPRSHLSSDVWKVDFAYHPAGVVSGDYVDVIRQDDELYFILGDVSGKGLAASILMSNLHAMFHALIPLKLSLCDLMSRANRLFCESTLANQYATLVCGKINGAGEVEFCNAGHLPPIVLNHEGGVQIETAGLPLGMFCDSSFVSSGVKLMPGETLLLFTDGVTEANNHLSEEFGVTRLLELITGAHLQEPGDLLTNCLSAITSFRNNTARNDDLTMMALKFTGTEN